MKDKLRRWAIRKLKGLTLDEAMMLSPYPKAKEVQYEQNMIMAVSYVDNCIPKEQAEKYATERISAEIAKIIAQDYLEMKEEYDALQCRTKYTGRVRMLKEM